MVVEVMFRPMIVPQSRKCAQDQLHLVSYSCPYNKKLTWTMKMVMTCLLSILSTVESFARAPTELSMIFVSCLHNKSITHIHLLEKLPCINYQSIDILSIPKSRTPRHEILVIYRSTRLPFLQHT